METKAMNRVNKIASTIGVNTQTNGVVARKAGFFNHVPVAPPNEIFNTAALCNKDPDPRKVNLGIGAYRDNNGKPYVLKVVRKAERLIANDTSLNHEYLGISGLAGFYTKARELMFGTGSAAIKAGRIASCQTISGTGSLSLGADFLATYMKGAAVYLPNPTWPNHDQIFGRGSPVKKYRYWNESKRNLDLSGMLEDIKAAPEKSVIMLHACAHNPTGVDPTQDQWKQIAQVCKSRNHLVYFDCAYQGFATGDLDADAWAVRYFVDQGFEMLVSQSFAKNFGLYDCRVGTLSIVCEDSKKAAAVSSQLEILIRASYSNPPAHGARIVEIVLNDKELSEEWKGELKLMSGRIIQCRKLLLEELKRLGTPGDWTHITSQIGMFSYTGLSKAQCKVLLEKHHIYLLSNGRISMAGINTGNVKYLAQCIHEVVVNVK